MPLTEQERENVSASVKTACFNKGDVVFKQGELCQRIYYIRTGLVKLSYLTLEGKELIKSFIDEGQMFGSLSSQLTGKASTFSAIALEDLHVDVLEYTVLREVIENNAAMQKILLQFFQQLALKKEIREYELLCLSAQQRYEKICEESPDIVARIKQADLALYLGITPIALSRLKHRDKKA